MKILTKLKIWLSKRHGFWKDYFKHFHQFNTTTKTEIYLSNKRIKKNTLNVIYKVPTKYIQPLSIFWLNRQNVTCQQLRGDHIAHACTNTIMWNYSINSKRLMNELVYNLTITTEVAAKRDFRPAMKLSRT